MLSYTWYSSNVFVLVQVVLLWVPPPRHPSPLSFGRFFVLPLIRTPVAAVYARTATRTVHETRGL